MKCKKRKFKFTFTIHRSLFIILYFHHSPFTIQNLYMFIYPKQSAFNRVLPKSKIYQHARPTHNVRQRFVGQVSRVVWAYKLSPDTINLAAGKGVPEIQIFSITLKTDELTEDVLQCIDKAISFPIFYELEYNQRIKEIAAYKRPSDSNSSKWVVGDYFETAWLSVESKRQPLPIFLDLAGLYDQMLRRLMPHPARNGESLKAHIKRLEIIRSKEKEYRSLETRMKKEKQFNRKVELNAKLRTIKTELESLIG